MLPSTLLSVLALLTTTHGATITPPSYALAVRNPYLHAWMPGPSASNIARTKAQFWNGNQLTWQIMARVNNATYALLGFPTLPAGVTGATFTSSSYTSTHSYFNLAAGGVSFMLDFFSPVSPTSNVDQSMPFSFFSVQASSSSAANVEVFVAIDDTWLAGATYAAPLVTTTTTQSTTSSSSTLSILLTTSTSQASTSAANTLGNNGPTQGSPSSSLSGSTITIIGSSSVSSVLSSSSAQLPSVASSSSSSSVTQIITTVSSSLSSSTISTPSTPLSPSSVSLTTTTSSSTAPVSTSTSASTLLSNSASSSASTPPSSTLTTLTSPTLLSASSTTSSHSLSTLATSTSSTSQVQTHPSSTTSASVGSTSISTQPASTAKATTSSTTSLAKSSSSSVSSHVSSTSTLSSTSIRSTLSTTSTTPKSTSTTLKTSSTSATPNPSTTTSVTKATSTTSPKSSTKTSTTSSSRKFTYSRHNKRQISTQSSSTTGISVTTASNTPASISQYQLSFAQSSSYSYFSFQNTSAVPFTEKGNQAVWGSIQLAVLGAETQVFASSGPPAQLQQNFISSGALSGSVNNVLNIGELVAFAVNLGSVSETSEATFAIGNYRNESLLFTAATANSVLSAYFTATYSTLDAAFQYFLNSYGTLYTASQALDSQIRSAASAISSNYADMAEAAVRQAYGATELLIDSENPDLANPMAFLKEISSDGDANSLDVIKPTIPIYLYLNPSWIKYHLQPYINYLASGRWSKAFIPHDLGIYPTALGPGSENMPLQNTASYFQMLYALNVATNGASLPWIQAQSAILAPIAANLLTIANATTVQLATVDWAGSHANQTGLALQGAQGLQIYGTLFNQPNYTAAGTALSKQLYEGGLGLDAARTHFTYLYGSGQDSSWVVNGASSFLDRVMGLNAVNSSAWDLEEVWYGAQTTSLGLPYIGGYNTTGDGCNPHGTLAITEWTLWAAAGMRNQTLQRVLLDGIYSFFSDGLNNVPWPTRYCTSGQQAGIWQVCRARSTVGSVFAPLVQVQGSS